MTDRGAQRNTKGRHARSKRGAVPRVADEPIEWARAEIERVSPLIEKAHKYLERELERLAGEKAEDGNAKETILLLRHFTERQDRAIKIRDELSRPGAAQPASAASDEERRRYDLSRFVDADPS